MNLLATPLAAAVLAGCAVTPPQPPTPQIDLIEVHWCDRPYMLAITRRDGSGPQFLDPDTGTLLDDDTNTVIPVDPAFLLSLHGRPAHRIVVPCATGA